MSSSTFETTFKSVRDRLAKTTSEQVLQVVEQFERRANSSGNTDPREDPNLIIEPKIDAQIIGVPLEVVQEAVNVLRQANLVHTWVRVDCPAAEERDDATILETDRLSDFRMVLSEPCPHCGGRHEGQLGWDSLHTFLAFNFDVSPRRLRLGDFLKQRQKLPEFETERTLPKRLLDKTKSFF